MNCSTGVTTHWTQITDRFVLAAGSTYKVGNTGGEVTHTLTSNEIPVHKHKVEDNMNTNNLFTRYRSGGNSGNFYGEIITPSSPQYIYSDEGNAIFRIVARTMVGDYGEAHNNMPPYIVAYCWRRTS